MSCSWRQSELNCTNLWRIKCRGISLFALHALKVKKTKLNNCHVFFVLLNIFMRLVSICTQLSMKSSCVIPWPTFHGLCASRVAKPVSFLFHAALSRQTECHSGFAPFSSSVSLSLVLLLFYPALFTLCSAQVSIRASSCRKLQVVPTACSGPKAARLMHACH